MMKSLTNNKDGLILMISLWILALISLLCLSLAHRVIVDLKLVRFQKDRMKCLYIAKAGIQKSINVLESDLTPETDMLNELWSRGYDEEAPGDGYIFKDIEVGDGIFTVSYLYDDTNSQSPVYFYGMSDEDRKININAAGEELLKSLFGLITSEDAETLAKAIRYWRGEDPEDYTGSYYESPEIPYPARRAPFKTIEELSLVEGFRENLELIEECKKFLTVYTEDNLININTAPYEILKAVFVSLDADLNNPGFSDRLAYNVVDYRDGADNEEATDDDTPITEQGIIDAIQYNLIDPIEKSWVTNHSQYFPFTAKSNLFRIEVLAKLNTSKIQKKVTAIIDRSEGLSEGPPQIRYWHEE